MRTATISMTARSLAELAGMLGQAGKWFLPESSGNPREFIQAREEWETSGLAELDFDGTIHPSQNFARIIYDLQNITAAMRYRNEQTGEQILYLRAPLETMRLEQSTADGDWEVALRPFHEMVQRIRSRISLMDSGELATLGDPDGEPLVLRLGEDMDAQSRSLSEHMTLFYHPERPLPETSAEIAEILHKEEKDAGDSDRNDPI